MGRAPGSGAGRGARARLDLTRNPDPARLQEARFDLEQAQAQLDARREQLALEVEEATQAVRQAEAELTRPGSRMASTCGSWRSRPPGPRPRPRPPGLRWRPCRPSAPGGPATREARRPAGGRRPGRCAPGRGALALRSRPFTAEELRGARAQVDQARATLSAAQAQQREATVRAPRDGVVAQRLASPGPW